MKLMLASRNAHKAQELAALLAPHEVVPLPDDVVLPPETGTTFQANARIKAEAALQATGGPVVADDSGIESAALGGRPGVWSARFAGEHATDEQNLRKLMDAVPVGSALAYVCVLVCLTPDGREMLAEGRCTGVMAAAARGEGGFGYDPCFVPDDLEGPRTMAELAPEAKAAISHRGRAARTLLEQLSQVDGGRQADGDGHEAVAGVAGEEQQQRGDQRRADGDQPGEAGKVH